VGVSIGFICKKLLAALILPPFGPLLAMLLGAALVVRARYAGRVLFLGGAALAFLLSLPVVASWAQWPFETQFPPIRAIPVDAQAIVVLGGGRDLGALEWGGETVSPATLVRLRYAAWLVKLSHRPVLVTGGKPDGGRNSEAALMAQTLSQDFATPVKWQEGNSVDTVENAEKSRAILEPEHIDTVVLVTDVVHMSRAMRDFQAAGFTPIAAPVGYAVSASLSWQSFLPDPNAYMRSSAVLRELLGLGWLRLVNWIGTWHMPFSD
jgi:uncharacterized SAM-binding protein YcdF (DUF218 family)